MIKILIVDDHQIFIDGLSALLNNLNGIEVIGGARTADEAIAKANALRPDVIMMDIQMPEKNGIEATREILKVNKEIKIVGLTSANESIYIKKMLEAGASGYVLKNVDKDELLEVIHKVHAGEKYLGKEVSQELINNFSARAVQPSSLTDSLTRREKEILTMIAQGLTDKEIADKVFLSPLTVITHRKNLLSKLNLKNKVELTRFAIENKLI